MENTKLLDVKNLRISFRTINGTVKAVRGIDFSLYRGKTLAIVGESGSGKSVTSRAIMGILAPNRIIEEGEILFEDKDLLQLTDDQFCKIRGSKISMIFQDPLSSLNPIKKVGIQVTESMKLKRKAAKKEAKADFKKSYGIIKKYLGEHPDFPVKIADVDEAVKMFENKDSSELEFALAKYDRITSDNVLTYQKTIVAVADAKKKKALEEKLASYEAKRKLGHDKLEKELADFKAKLASDNKDYTKYDMSKMEQLMSGIFQEYYALLAKKVEENGNKLAAQYKTFSSLEGEEFINAVKANASTMTSLVLGCNNDLDLEKDETLYTFGVSIKHYVKDYYLAKKREANAAKKAKKDAGKKQKGQSTDPTLKERAWGSEISTSPATKVEKLKEVISSLLTSVQGDYLEKIKANCETSQNAKLAKDYAHWFTDNVRDFSHPVNNEEILERAIKVLGEVGIPEPQKRIKQYPFEFSGGMRQRIVIAIALSSNPEILICDEPTTALDVTIQAQILELINDLKKKHNLSIIFITHNLGVVANMADDIAVMYAGKIVEYGTVDEIFYEPKHPYTWALLASMPDLETKARLDAIPGTPPNMIIPPKGDAFAARNKYAMKIDYEKEPPRFYVSPTHWAATWLLADGAPKVDPPTIVTDRIKRMKALNKEASEGGKNNEKAN